MAKLMEPSGETPQRGTAGMQDLASRLARGDAMRASVTPILRHMLLHDDNALFSDEIVARVHGMIRSLAIRLLTAYAVADGVAEPQDYAASSADALSEYLSADETLLGYIHALALEARLSERLGERGIVDPVVPPLLQGLVAAQDATTAERAMAYLAAEARSLEQARRMELPLSQLPADHFHRALDILQACAGEEGEGAARKAADALRRDYSEAETRGSIAAKLISGLGRNARAALAIDHAGAALFLSAIAMASGQDRQSVVLACNDRRASRLGLMLKAAGLAKRDIEAQFAYLEIDPTLADDFEAASAKDAAALLGEGSA